MAAAIGDATAVSDKLNPGVKSFEGPGGVQHWPNFFGLPLGGELALQQQHDPYSRFPRETLHLPEVYKGHNPYLTQVMIEFITEEQLTPIRVILPLRETVNESTIVWDEYNFNNALLGPVPEEGVSRLVTQQISERQDHYVRGGLAFMIEHGFWQSEKGKQNYVLQLTQIKNATLDGLYIGVLESLLTCKNVANYVMQQTGHNPADGLTRSMKLEVEAFAEVQKNPNGWDMLNSRAHKALKSMGYTPDCWVVDEGTKRYIAMVRPENSQYMLGGPEGRALYNSALPAASNPKLLDQRTGCLIFETKSFESPDAKEPVNPMSRPQSIGEYNFSGPFFPVTRTDPYTSATRTICVYDEARDGWAYISLAEGIKHCGMFDGDFDVGKMFDNKPGVPDPASSDTPDMFKCTFGKSEGARARYIGDVNDSVGKDNTDALPDEAVSDWANSVMQGLEPEMEMTLRDLKDLINRMENSIVSGKSAEYFTAVAAEVNAHGLDKDGLVNLEEVVKNLASGGLKCMPHGFSSCAGLEYLANERFANSTTPMLKDLHAQAKCGMRAFNRLYARLESACYDNVFFRESAVPEYYRKKDGKYAFFSNLFHVPQPAMIFTKLSATVPARLDVAKLSALVQLTEPFYAMIKTMKTPEEALIAALNPANNGEDAQNAKLGSELATVKAGQTLSGKQVIHNLAAQLISAINLAMLAKDATLQVAMALATILGRCRFKDCFKTTPDTDSYGNFLLFVDRRTTVIRTYKDFATFFNHLASGTAVVQHDNPTLGGKKDWQFQDDVAPTAEGSVFAISADPGLHAANEISAMVAGRTIMEHVTNQKVAIRFTKDFVDATGADGKNRSYRTTAYGHDSMDGAPGPKRQGIGLIAAHAALANLPASVGGAAFAAVEAMPGEHAGTLDRERFNFSDAAATQRALNRDQYRETELFNRHSDQFERRFNDLNHEPEHMTRVVRQALLGVPLTQKALEHFIARDVVFPFNMLYFRPYMTYEMSSGVCLKCGAGTGETLIGQSDFQMGDDVQRKVHFGHYTIKYKSVVYNHRAVYHAYNYMCTGYVGGNDTRFVTQESDTRFNQTQDTAHFHSMYACLVPYQRKSYCNPMVSSRGTFRATNIVTLKL